MKKREQCSASVKAGRRGAATAARWRGGVGERASLRELAYGTDGSEVGGRGVGDKCLQRVCILRHGGIGGRKVHPERGCTYSDQIDAIASHVHRRCMKEKWREEVGIHRGIERHHRAAASCCGPK